MGDDYKGIDVNSVVEVFNSNDSANVKIFDRIHSLVLLCTGYLPSTKLVDKKSESYRWMSDNEELYIASLFNDASNGTVRSYPTYRAEISLKRLYRECGLDEDLLIHRIKESTQNIIEEVSLKKSPISAMKGGNF